MSLIKQTNIFWHIFLVLRTGVLSMFKQIDSDTSLPLEYKDYRLQTVLVSSPRGIGVYENNSGQKVLIKIWRGQIKTYEYYQLMNEIRLYTLLHGVLNRVRPLLEKEYQQICIPQLLEKEISDTHILSVFEYIDDCVQLKDVNSFSKKSEIFELAIDFWKYIGDQFNSIEKSQISRRTLFGTLFAYWVSLIYALIRYPREIPSLLRTVPIVFQAIPSLYVNWREGLVHRDFHFENVLLSKEKIVIIDFGDNAFTSLLQIFTNSLHWEWNNDESRKVILKGIVTLCGASRETASVFRALFAISAVQLLHDTESKKRLELNFQCFNAVLYNWNDISIALSGDISADNVFSMKVNVKDFLISLLGRIRAPFVRFTKPKSKYPLFPISTKFGFDRGTPIDRFYIELFLSENLKYIHGKCLEIGNNKYTLKYGGAKVSKSDVLDVDTKNKKANIYGDIRNLHNIPDNTYDCVIITHTLGVIDDHESAVREVVRILKTGGTLLITVSSVGVMQNPEQCFWRYTPVALKYLFGKHVLSKNITVRSYGNILAGQAFWVGLAKEEFTEDELLFDDPRYAVISTAVVKK